MSLGVEGNTCKRSNYLSWDEYYMSLAILSASRSKDPITQVGACIVNDHKRIVGLGYNGMPDGCHDDHFTWSKAGKNFEDNNHLFVVHAELNAILNANSTSLRGCSLFVTLFPCNECAKAIIQSGIKKIFYMSDKNAGKDSNTAAKYMFMYAGVDCKQYQPSERKIVEINLLTGTVEI